MKNFRLVQDEFVCRKSNPDLKGRDYPWETFFQTYFPEKLHCCDNLSVSELLNLFQRNTDRLISVLHKALHIMCCIGDIEHISRIPVTGTGPSAHIAYDDNNGITFTHIEDSVAVRFFSTEKFSSTMLSVRVNKILPYEGRYKMYFSNESPIKTNNYIFPVLNHFVENREPAKNVSYGVNLMKFGSKSPASNIIQPNGLFIAATPEFTPVAITEDALFNSTLLYPANVLKQLALIDVCTVTEFCSTVGSYLLLDEEMVGNTEEALTVLQNALKSSLQNNWSVIEQNAKVMGEEEYNRVQYIKSTYDITG